jgi:hypothetical protein
MQEHQRNKKTSLHGLGVDNGSLGGQTYLYRDLTRGQMWKCLSKSLGSYSRPSAAFRNTDVKQNEFNIETPNILLMLASLLLRTRKDLG